MSSEPEFHRTLLYLIVYAYLLSTAHALSTKTAWVRYSFTGFTMGLFVAMNVYFYFTWGEGGRNDWTEGWSTALTFIYVMAYYVCAINFHKATEPDRRRKHLFRLIGLGICIAGFAFAQEAIRGL